jgi:hypothetical protein
VRAVVRVESVTVAVGWAECYEIGRAGIAVDVASGEHGGSLKNTGGVGSAQGAEQIIQRSDKGGLIFNDDILFQRVEWCI